MMLVVASAAGAFGTIDGDIYKFSCILYYVTVVGFGDDNVFVAGWFVF